MVLWLKRLYDEGILDKDYALMTTAQWEEAFANERAAFAVDFIGRVEMINGA
jgi:ABC-type glycerol-3-phosphate transport system substrate-binding protein